MVKFVGLYVGGAIRNTNMPVIFLDRIPLPTLKAYTCVSVVALSACVYVAVQTIKDPNWNSTQTEQQHDHNNTLSLGQLMYQIFSVMIREPISVWVCKLSVTSVSYKS